jgi:hypothetical protein
MTYVLCHGGGRSIPFGAGTTMCRPCQDKLPNGKRLPKVEPPSQLSANDLALCRRIGSLLADHKQSGASFAEAWLKTSRFLRLTPSWQSTWRMWQIGYNSIGPRPKLTPGMIEDEWLSPTVNEHHIKHIC